jgi:hypothetical protein
MRNVQLHATSSLCYPQLMNFGFVGFVLVAVAFLWLIGATIRSPDRKKFFGLTLLALTVGLITGFEVAWQWYIPELRRTVGG